MEIICLFICGVKAEKETDRWINAVSAIVRDFSTIVLRNKTKAKAFRGRCSE